MLKYYANGPINALSSSPSHTQVVLAGREVLKVLDVSEDFIEEALNLRVGKINLNFSSNDVKWCPNFHMAHYIATAATNGAVVIWNLLKKSHQKQGNQVDSQKRVDEQLEFKKQDLMVFLLERVFTEHTRAVNRICFHPTNSNLLMSGSQDGTIKLWDLRGTDKSILTMHGRSESVRDVQFSPTNTNEWVSSFENGAIQIWDIRHVEGPEKIIHAHNGLVLSADYHPEGRYLVSGGRDKLIHIWDLKLESRKPEYTFQTIASVARVLWRPGFPSQFASCSLHTDFRITIWDSSRCHLPILAFEEHQDAVTALLWRDNFTLWSSSKDRFLIQNSIEQAYVPSDQLAHSAVCWSAHGKMGIVLETRPSDSKKHDFETSSRTGLLQTSKHYRSLGDKVTDLKEEHLMRDLALGYTCKGDDIPDLCRKNSEIARECSAEQAYRTWCIMYHVTMFLKPAAKVPTTVSYTSSADNSESFLDPLDDQFSPESEDDFNCSIQDESNEDLFSDEEPLERIVSMSLNEESQPQNKWSNVWSDERKIHSLKTMPYLQTNEQQSLELANDSQLRSTLGNCLLVPEFQLLDMIPDLLQSLIDRGDIATAVTLLMIANDHIKIDEKLQEQWIFSYIELLRRFELYDIATEIAHYSRSKLIREQNQSSTIYTSCPICLDPLVLSQMGYWACGKCNRVISICALCLHTVRGLYTCCRVCGHGGHLDHWNGWFSNHDQCPTGCGHRCMIRPS